jgi:hypothetical protein
VGHDNPTVHPRSKCGPRKDPTMPIYEYACHDCGNAFELLVRSSTVP